MTASVKDQELVRSLRKRLGLTQEKFAHLLGTTARTISRWERGQSRCEKSWRQKLANLQQVVDKLADCCDEIPVFLSMPLPEFNDFPPTDLLGSDWSTVKLLDWIQRWGEGDLA